MAEEQQYADSVEFTEDIEQIHNIINSKRWVNWLANCDTTNGTNCLAIDGALRMVLIDLQFELDKAS